MAVKAQPNTSASGPRTPPAAAAVAVGGVRRIYDSLRFLCLLSLSLGVGVRPSSADAINFAIWEMPSKGSYAVKRRGEKAAKKVAMFRYVF